MKQLDDLFLSFLRHRDLNVVAKRLRSRGETNGSFDVERLVTDLTVLEQTPPSEFTEAYARLSGGLPVALRRLYVFRYVISRVVAHPLSTGQYDQIDSLAGAVDPECQVLIDICRTVGGWVTGVETRPVDRLEEIKQRTSRLDLSVSAAFVDSMADHSLGYGYQELGNFREAQRCFSRAADLSSFYEFYTLPIYRSAFAKLMWESGQFRKALELQCDGETRRLARELGDNQFLIDSNLCAAKAALDLGSLRKAEEELSTAAERLRDCSERYPILNGYRMLFSAQLAARQGRNDQARTELAHVIEYFDSMDPPCFAGALDAKIEQVRMNLVDHEVSHALQRIGELLTEADEREVMGARTRLMAFQAHMYINPKSPNSLLRLGYDDLVERLHLMNNPRLTFLAYADLYSYARQHLGREDQKNWLIRLRNLEPLLEHSCYEELYRDYVTEKYRAELERELEEFRGWETESSRD